MLYTSSFNNKNYENESATRKNKYFGGGNSIYSRTQSMDSSMDRNFGEIGNQKNINAYHNDIPIKSYYKESDSNKRFSLSSSKFEPNFHSDVYKSQAKRSF